MFFLSCVNETIHLLGNMPLFKIHVNCFMARGESPCAILSQNACCERWAWYNTLCLRHSFIWLAACYQVYNALLKTSKGALFLSPSEVYVRSFLYPIYTLIKLYYKNSSEWSSLVSGSRLKSSLRPRIPDLLTAHGSNLSELYLCVTEIIYFYLN